MATTTLTGQQERVLRFIQHFQRTNGYSPTVREIAKHIGSKNPNAVVGSLEVLEDIGAITRVPGKSRTIRATGKF